MINKENLKDLLTELDFKSTKNVFSKHFAQFDAFLKIDFDKETIIYPEDKGLIINERQTCNFSQNENFVVFECVHRLMKQGYAPEHIELEPKWKIGHGASGGRADILVKNQLNSPLLIIECKTAGKEFDKDWKNTQIDGAQLFSYIEQEKSVQFVCLYASDFNEKNEKSEKITTDQRIISHIDNKEILADDPKLKTFKDASNVIERFRVWKETYQLESTEKGIFEDNIQAYSIGKEKYTLDNDTKVIDATDKKGKYHQFRTILRKYNVSRRENAFEVLVNLFLCKIVDEKQNKENLKFYWKGIAYDNYYSLVDRLQELYKIGMGLFLHQDVLYISNKQIDDAFWAAKGEKGNATKLLIKDMFRQLKFYKGLDFDFIKVNNKQNFDKNAKILLEIIQMWQGLRLKTKEQNQFLGDMFEFFLDNGIKQSEGQFFTPVPICKFIVMSLPLEEQIKNKNEALKAIDYACGSGHFLTEYATQIKPLVKKHKQSELSEYYKGIYGIEKEDRLAKVAKVSAFMYGQEEINIIDADALATQTQIEENTFDVLVANPPFAVEDFLMTLEETDREKYELLKAVSELGNKNIQCFFLERAKQLLATNGVAGIVVPSSILSNSDAMHVQTREILLKYFDFIAIAELGSGTFGKTGTNTVVLFLRRKAQRPEPAEHYENRANEFFNNWTEECASGGGAYADSDVVKKYCQHINLSFEDYQTLLEGDPSVSLRQTEMFADYKTDFDKSTEIINLKDRFRKQHNDLLKTIVAEFNKSNKSKDSLTEQQNKAKSLLPQREAALKAAQETELNKRFIAYLKKIEQEKLYYFMLANANPQPVLIVKSPSDNKEQKQFLGYEWSNAKGNEGISYNGGETVYDIKTPMFDPNDAQNNTKINYYIQQNFQGIPLSIPEHLKPFLSVTPLEDLLDFSRKDFNKTISSMTKNVAITENWTDKYPSKKLSEIVQINPSKTEISKINEDTIISFVEMASVSDKGFISEKIDKPLKDLKKGSYTYFAENDIIIAKITPCMENGKCALAVGLTNNLAMGSSEFHVFRAKTIIESKYIFNLLNREIVRKEAEKNMTGSSGHRRVPASFYENYKIPLPPLSIQAEIVAKCEAIDEAVNRAKNRVMTNTRVIEAQVQSVYSKGYSVKKLGDICTMQAGKFVSASEISDKPEKELYPCYGGNGLRGYTKTMTHEGTFSLIGRQGALCGNINKASGKFHATEHAVVVTPNPDINNNWLYYQLKSMNLNQYATGVAQPGLSVQKILTITTPVPPLAEQEQLLKAIEQLEAQISVSQQLIDSAAREKQAIMTAYL